MPNLKPFLLHRSFSTTLTKIVLRLFKRLLDVNDRRATQIAQFLDRRKGKCRLRSEAPQGNIDARPGRILHELMVGWVVEITQASITAEAAFEIHSLTLPRADIICPHKQSHTSTAHKHKKHRLVPGIIDTEPQNLTSYAKRGASVDAGRGVLDASCHIIMP